MNQPVSPSNSRRWLAAFLVLLPAWLIGSACIGLWYQIREGKSRDLRIDHAFSRMVSAESITDDLHKVTRVIGERNRSSDGGDAALRQTASMIEGALGPSNTGLIIRKTQSPTPHPILTTEIPGKDPAAPAVWVLASYDSKPASVGVESNATGLVATIAAAQALVHSTPERSIRFAFLPHANEPNSPVMETVEHFLDIARGAHLFLCVEAMGGGKSLWLTCRDTDFPAIQHLDGLGDIKGAEVTCLNEDIDLASMIFERGETAIRVSTRAQVYVDDPDDTVPDSGMLAAATGRLVTLIQRCSSL